ncbi:MAG: GlyGly-CTERM sorting domain-containing protein, partial [Gammaproteobacteria bacterium]
DPEEGDPEEGDPEGMSDDEGSSEKGGSIGFYLLSMLLVISWRRKRKV